MFKRICYFLHLYIVCSYDDIRCGKCLCAQRFKK